MHMTVKHSYLIQLANILEHPERIFGGKCSGSVAYKVYMNFNTAKPFREGFQQAFPADPKWIEYSHKHDNVYAEAKVNTIQELAALPQEKQDEINAAIAAIDEEYKDTIEKEHAAELERRKMLDEDVEVDLYTVSPDDIEIAGQDAWQLWAVLFNEGNGFIRETAKEG